tara:strand:+ start:2759 stop:2971 length:213 start_codon:yes stop_codon:yes gene_type:complete
MDYTVNLDEKEVREKGLQIYQDLMQIPEPHPEDMFIIDVLERLLEKDYPEGIPQGYGTNEAKKIYYTEDE